MRQFIVEKGKEKNGLIQLDGKDYRYLRQVLRVRAGDMISVRLSSGDLKNATVAAIDECRPLLAGDRRTGDRQIWPGAADRDA